MALKQNTGHIILFLVIVVFQLQSQQCDALPDWADIGWKTSGVASALADTLKERSRNIDGAVNSIDATNKFFRRLSKFGAAAGSLFALSGTIVSIFDDSDKRKHDELLSGFSDVKNGLSNINSKMDKIIKVIKHEHAKTKGFQSFAKIEGAVLILDNYNRDPEPYKVDLMRYLQNNDMYNALISVFKLVNDGDSIVKTLYEETHGDLGAINNLRAYINGLIYTGSAVQTSICMLDQVDNRGKSAKQAKHTCYDIKGDDFEQLERALNDKFDTWEAKAKQNYKANIKIFMDEEYDSNDFNQGNKALAVSIRDKLKSSYSWVDLMVGVYNPISGWDNHAIYAQAYAFRDKNGKKNWLVMANDKKNTDSKTITRSSLKSIVEKASSTCKPNYCRYCRNSNYKKINARCVRANLKTELKNNGVHWFGLAVIKRNERLHGAWFPSNKFFFFNFDDFTIFGGIKGRILENLPTNLNIHKVSNVFGCNKVALKSYFGKYVVAELDGTANVNRMKRDIWEIFTVEDSGSNKISLISHHGKYIVAEDGKAGYDINANRDNRGPWEIFTVEKQAGGTIALKTAHGRYVVAEPDGRLRGDRTNADIWERFSIECIPGAATYSYRISNKGYTGWRPAVAEIRVFSDQSCTNEIDATYVAESGHNSGFGDGSVAFDDNSVTSWRPQCHPCNENVAWLTFSTTQKAHCVTASNLGKGAGGGENWNGGIVVEQQYSDNSWTTAMQSHNGNIAKSATTTPTIIPPTTTTTTTIISSCKPTTIPPSTATTTPITVTKFITYTIARTTKTTIPTTTTAPRSPTTTTMETTSPTTTAAETGYELVCSPGYRRNRFGNYLSDWGTASITTGDTVENTNECWNLAKQNVAAAIGIYFDYTSPYCTAIDNATSLMPWPMKFQDDQNTRKLCILGSYTQRNTVGCSSWPLPSTNRGCRGGSWKKLKNKISISQTEACELLCRQQKEKGCCFLEDKLGCYWKGDGKFVTDFRSTDNNRTATECYIGRSHQP